MPIFFPGNDKRKTRVVELGSDTESFLHDATEGYKTFQALCQTVNQQIAAVYQAANLQPPSVSKVDVLKAAGATDTVSTEETIVEVIEILVDIAGFATTLKYLAPAATQLLTKAGLMSADQAAAELFKFTVPLIEREVVLSWGDVAGGVIGGVVGGAAIAGIDLGIEALEGSSARDALRDGIHKLYPMRTTTRIALDKTNALLKSLQAIKTTMDAISGAGVPLTDQLIQNLIVKDAQPAINAEQEITVATVTIELNQLDLDRGSWTVEDEH